MRISAAAYGSGTRGAMTLALLALACAVTPLAAQEVYKSVDAQGHVVYSDRGAVQNAPKTSLHVDEPDPAEVARLAHEDELLKADEQARLRQQAIDDKNKAQQQRKHQQACEQARKEAYLRMLEHADDRDADAVIAMRYDATEFAQGTTEVLAYGTAVRLERA